MVFAIGGGVGKPIFNALRHLSRDANRLSIAVSYIQVSGWELLWDLIPRNSRPGLRILCTDQLGISDPKAIREIIATGTQIRAFKPTNVVFHPKVFIGHRDNIPDRYMLGSANLSRAALLTSVEIDQSGTDNDGRLTAWFDDLFNDKNKSADFDEARLKALEAAFAARVKSRLAFQRAITASTRAGVPEEANASSTVGSIFAGLLPEPGVAPLNFDKAGNNVRRLGTILDVLHGITPLRGKALSEMKLLGFADGDQARLNARGMKASQSRTVEALARAWITWLKNASSAELQTVSPSGQLEQARAAFKAFWTMQPAVRDFFIANSERPTKAQRPILQTIELLANAGRRIDGLSLDDVTTLSTILTETSDLPPAAAEAVHGYLNNKGTRGWPYPDRRIAVEAWRNA